MFYRALIALLLSAALSACVTSTATEAAGADAAPKKAYPITKTDAEWRAELSKEEYRVLREKGTERPFTGDLLTNPEHGTYVCAACGEELFPSHTKFKSGTGWPSFYAPKKGALVDTIEDRSMGMTRTEVVCGRCGGHLGHVFRDGPEPTGLRYCINSVSMDFVPE